MEGVARFLSEPAGRRDQVRAGRRAVPGPGHARQTLAARRAGSRSSRSTARSPPPMSVWWTATASVCSKAVSFDFPLGDRCGDRRPEQQRQESRPAALCPPRHSDKRAACSSAIPTSTACRWRFPAGGSVMSARSPISFRRASGTICCSACVTGRTAMPDDGSAERAVARPRDRGGAEIRQHRLRYRRRLDRLSAGGVADAAELELRMIEVLRLVDLEEDVHLFGLRGRLDPGSPAGCGAARPRSAPGARRAPRRRRSCSSRRALRPGPLQHQFPGFRQSAVRHPDRTGL